MRVLLDHSSPFLLAHGGFQIQIEQTKKALEANGVGVEYLRWWDEAQGGDLIHYFGRPPGAYVDLAHKKGFRVVMAELLTGMGSRSGGARMLQKVFIRVAKALLPSDFTARMSWDSYQKADAFVALTQWEAQLMVQMFSAQPDKVRCVPNGVEPIFFEQPVASRNQWLICTATITERKRTLELAEAAVEARTPVWIVGKPYSDTDPYAVRFMTFARRYPDLIRYEGGIGDRAQLAKAYRSARGFVLLSTMESLSLSALEAAACGCPLLLSDLPWARTAFGPGAQYCPVGRKSSTAAVLKRFHDAAPSLGAPGRPLTWLEVGAQLKSVYESVLKTSR